MRSIVKYLPLLLLLAACKKDTPAGATLNVSGFSAAVFATGDAVSIYGSGFDPDPTKDVVLFNGVPGEVATASANRLQVIVPLLIDDGKVTVAVHGQTAESRQSYTIVNVLQGLYTANFILTPDKRYLLRGPVVFQGKLIIQAGTVIYGEKVSHASLTASDVDWEGTAANPIVFTSDQASGDRAPGDWTGISLVTPVTPGLNLQFAPLGQATYVRVEYAGFHANGAGVRGVAVNLYTDNQSTLRYIEAAYSAGDGFEIQNETQSSATAYADHLVAVGCAGDDFLLNYGTMVIQFALGLKDPYNADVASSNGLGVNGGGGVMSNFTLVGYNPTARNVAGASSSSPLNNNAGAGVSIGEFVQDGRIGSAGSGGNFFMYNSVIAAGWKAGLALYGIDNPDYSYPYALQSNFIFYEDSIPWGSGEGVRENQLRYNYFVGTAPADYPFRGGIFARQGHNPGAQSAFDDVTATHQDTLFGFYNDTANSIADIGIQGLTDYGKLTAPVVLPATGSPLLTGARFPAFTNANNPLLNKDVLYIGAFGTVDWTANWCNFNPQQTQY